MSGESISGRINTKLIVALALISFGSVLQTFAADTVNDRAPHEFLDLCSVSSSLFAERIFPRSGSYGLARLHKTVGTRRDPPIHYK